MKKTFLKNLWREIYKNLGRFVAVFAISALGVGFLAGLLATTPDMRLSADINYDNHNMMDIRVISTLGLTDSAISAIKSAENVQAVMPSYNVDALVALTNGDTVVGRVHALPENMALENQEYINQVEITHGRLPINDGECVVQVSGYGAAQVSVGDVLHFSPDNKDIGDIIQTKPLRVVGLVQSPYYFSLQRESSNIGNGDVGVFIYIMAESFISDVYTEAYITLKNAKEYNSFDEDYTQYVEQQVETLEKLGQEQSAIRTQEVRGEVQDKLDDAQNTLETQREKAEVKLLEAKSELNDAEKKLLDGEKQLRQAKKTLADGAVAYDAAYSKAMTAFDEQQAQLDKSKIDLEVQVVIWQQSKKQTDEAYQQFLASLPEGVDPETVPVPEELKAAMEQVLKSGQQLDAAKEQLAAGQSQLSTAKAQAVTQFAAKKLELDKGNTKIEIEEKTLATGKADYAQGLAEYEKGKKDAELELTKAQEKIFDAQDEIKKIEAAEWYVLDRNANVSYVTYEQNAEKVSAIAKIFPLFFFMVAALVTVTTMTRMVDEQRTQIGTMKALGYGKAAIAAKYILYAGAASISGSLVGILIGFKLFPTVIYNAYSMMYVLPPLHTPINIDIAALAALAAIVCSVGSAVEACRRELKEAPAILMLPKAPPAGKRILLERISPIWRRMKFTQKVTARNLMRYKKRLFMTVIGVAGCTALLLTGFGLRDSIGDIIGKQFGDIYNYNLMIGVKNQRVINQQDGIKTVLDNPENVESYTIVAQEKATILVGETSRETTIYVPSDSAVFPQYITLQERVSTEPTPLSDDGAVVTEKMAKTLGIGKGDSFSLENNSGARADFIVSGVCENYVESYIYITERAYNTAFGALPEYTMVVAQVPDISKENRDAITADLLKIEGVAGVNFVEDIKVGFQDMLTNITYIVMVLIISAGALAFIVLYNLTNINITERQRELATIKVLGFYDSEVAAYIYRETILMSVLGTLAGLGLGIILHRFVVVTAEVDMVMFGRDIYWLSYVYAAALTLFFSFSVNLVMNRKMRKIDMIESLKANE